MMDQKDRLIAVANRRHRVAEYHGKIAVDLIVNGTSSALADGEPVEYIDKIVDQEVRKAATAAMEAIVAREAWAAVENLNLIRSYANRIGLR